MPRPAAAPASGLIPHLYSQAMAVDEKETGFVKEIRKQAGDFPGWNNDVVTCGLFPITMVTAIVSPKALPKPSITAPMMPVRA